MNNYPPVTKESLLEGVLKLFEMDAISVEIVLHQVKQITHDNKIPWKGELSK